MDLRDYDMVITTYDTLRVDFNHYLEKNPYLKKERDEKKNKRKRKPDKPKENNGKPPT